MVVLGENLLHCLYLTNGEGCLPSVEYFECLEDLDWWRINDGWTICSCFSVNSVEEYVVKGPVLIGGKGQFDRLRTSRPWFGGHSRWIGN
ncbi:hypothetical protein BG842_07285 [Haladaptatus sp. W1]|nr:hypothetical protein BG842_07285 [Haladaptatus sp. W1]